MPAIRPVAAPLNASSTPAGQGAALLMRIFDQARTEKRFDEERTLPPDGRLHRDEFPSARFGAIDSLETADGAIDERELQAALARLSAADQQLVLAEAQAATTRLEAKGRAFLKSFAGFALGGVGIVAGLLVGGPLGLGALALGGVGLLFGFGSAVATIFASGKVAKRLFETLDATLGRASL